MNFDEYFKQIQEALYVFQRLELCRRISYQDKDEIG